MPEPPVDEQFTVNDLPESIAFVEIVEVLTSAADVTLRVRSLFFIVPAPSFTFTRIVYVVAVPGLKVTLVVVE